MEPVLLYCTVFAEVNDRNFFLACQYDQRPNQYATTKRLKASFAFAEQRQKHFLYPFICHEQSSAFKV